MLPSQHFGKSGHISTRPILLLTSGTGTSSSQHTPRTMITEKPSLVTYTKFGQLILIATGWPEILRVTITPSRGPWICHGMRWFLINLIFRWRRWLLQIFSTTVHYHLSFQFLRKFSGSWLSEPFWRRVEYIFDKLRRNKSNSLGRAWIFFQFWRVLRPW